MCEGMMEMNKLSTIFKNTDWYKRRILNKLFNDIQHVIELDEIGYHEIMNGKLNPIHKTETSVLSAKKWKEVHSQNPVYIKNNPLLIEAIDERKIIAVPNTHEDERSSEAFGLFGIDSIMVIPVSNNQNVVKSFVIIPTMKRFYNFTEDEIVKCEQIVSKYSNLLV